MNNKALILFAKTPLPNFSKTRLINPFTPEQAAQFYAACLKDIYQTMTNSVNFKMFVAIAPERFNANQFPFALNDPEFFFQQGNDLGMRMREAFQFVFGLGYNKVAIIGSDFPHISENTIVNTFNHLEKYNCVLGPATDGGYYLIGLNRIVESIFEDITWSTAKVYNQTVKKLRESNILFKNIETQYDVDTAREMKQLYFDLNKMDNTLKNFPYNVWQFLQTNKNKLL